MLIFANDKQTIAQASKATNLVKYLWLLCLLAIFSSCTVLNPERMLRTPTGFDFDTFDLDKAIEEYRLAPNDEISILLFSNDGERLINPIGQANTQRTTTQQGSDYLIEYDGLVKIPVLGRVELSGMTLREAEVLLENKFANYYNRPFVRLQVTNHRVIIFPGGRGGTSSVVRLNNTNTNLFEALAMSGGISDGRASRIKLIRGELHDPKVYLIDLSTIEGMKNADMTLQANDIIYVEPRERIPQRILENIGPYLSLISTSLVIYALFQ